MLSGWVWGGSENSEIGDREYIWLGEQQSVSAMTMVVGFNRDRDRERGFHLTRISTC